MLLAVSMGAMLGGIIYSLLICSDPTLEGPVTGQNAEFWIGKARDFFATLPDLAAAST